MCRRRTSYELRTHPVYFCMMKTTGYLGIMFLFPVAAWAQVDEPEGIEWVASPNYGERPAGQVIDTVVIHTTEGTSISGTISWFQSTSSQVSSHYVIGQDGTIVQMVALDKRAWHATYYNSRSVGIEMVGKAGDPATWTAANLEALGKLVAWLCDQYDIPVMHPEGDAYDYPNDTYTQPGLVAHGQIQPWNRSDPGAYFPWDDFVTDVSTRIAAGYAPKPLGKLSASAEWDRILFSWGGDPNATGYRVEIALSMADLEVQGGSYLSFDAGLETQFEWTGAAAETTYYWRVRATNNWGESIGEPDGPVTTPAGPSGHGSSRCSGGVVQGAPSTVIALAAFVMLGVGLRR